MLPAKIYNTFETFLLLLLTDCLYAFPSFNKTVFSNHGLVRTT